MSFRVRTFKESDRGYICRTILFTQWENDSATRRINKDSFLTNHNRIINNLLNNVNCLVLCDIEEEGVIYGFIIYEQSCGDFDILHYAQIRKDFRGLGLLKQLIPSIKTRDSLAISHTNNWIYPAKLKQFYTKIIYDPYLQTKERQ